MRTPFQRHGQTIARRIEGHSGRTASVRNVEQSWAQPFIQWLLTPALVAGLLIALAQLYNPPTRWARRLKSDIAIAAGLPEGLEREVWQESIAEQAERLRGYRRAFVGWTWFWKWLGVIYLGGALVGTILYPPINRPGDRYPLGPGDYIFYGLGLVLALVAAISISSGRDYWGRSSREVLLRRRVRQFDRRWRKLRRIEKRRKKRAETDSAIRSTGTRLGFSTQADEFGAFVRDRDMRAMIRALGWGGADLAAQSYNDLRGRGVEIPQWPLPEVRSNASTPAATVEVDGTGAE